MDSLNQNRHFINFRYQIVQSSFDHFTRVLFSDEVEAQRRRKSSGPTGRADAPLRRNQDGGGSGGGWLSGGGGSSGGGSGGLKLPPWLMVILVILFLIFGGQGALNSILSGTTNAPAVQGPTSTLPSINVSTAIPDMFTPQPVTRDGQTWTVIMYQDADDQILEEDIFTDFNEAERVGSTDRVQIVSQLDRFKGAFKGDGNWSGARRYYITKDDDLTKINSKLISDLGEVNMSDPATLVDFATWAIKTFPADHYVLILSDHGMGWPGGWTDGDSESSANPQGSAPLVKVMGNALYTNQLDQALEDIRAQSGVDKFDLIGMDACLMGQLEIFNMLAPHARYAVTSQETEPALGWAYTSFLTSLVENPGLSAADLSADIVNSYVVDDQRIVDDTAREAFLRQMGGRAASAAQIAGEVGKDVTIASVDLSTIPDLMKNVNNLAYALQSENQGVIAEARNYALSFTSIFGKQVPPAYIDLGSFAQILEQQSLDTNVQTLAADVLVGIKRSVLAEKHGSGKKGATGVAIYFPNSSLYRSPYSGPQSYTAVANRFVADSLWDDMLAFHYNDRSFESSSRSAVIPDAGSALRVPGAGLIQLSKLVSSSSGAAPGKPITLKADISGSNIGYIYLFIGFYDRASNSIFVADTDFLESPETRQVDGVYYPLWSKKESFTLKYKWDPMIFSISDGVKTSMALFAPQQYGASAEEAIYAVDGLYTFQESGEQLNARLNFRNGELVSVFGITGQAETGAPRQITPQAGDTFTLLEKWMDLNSDGTLKEITMQPGEILTFSDQPFKWVEQYAASGNYVVGFSVTDLDGNSKETYTTINVK